MINTAQPSDFTYFINNERQVLTNAIYHINKYCALNPTPVTFNRNFVVSTNLEPFGKGKT
jgi:hypothetical protein